MGWRGFERCRYEQTLKVIQDAIGKLQKPLAKVKILDVGCSGGSFTHLLRGLAGSVTGIDLSETAIQRARARFGDIIFQASSVYNPGLEAEAYDVIVCMEVIYYVPPSEQNAFLGAAKRLLAENGVVLISSKVGSPPYFNEEELVKLAGGHFKLDQICRYGWEPLARWEGFMFGLWKKAHTVRALLKNYDPTQPPPSPGSPMATTRRQVILQKSLFAASKYRAIGWSFSSFTWAIIALTGICLRWKTPSQLANWLARKSHLLPTHTVLLLAKNCQVPDSKTQGLNGTTGDWQAMQENSGALLR